MSRATRPLRRVRGAERAQLRAASWDRWPARLGRGDGEYSLRIQAYRLGCRPSHLRRCLLGRVVSARAAGRILDAAGARR